MPAIEPHIDLSRVDFHRVLADQAEIRTILPHRYEMELITAMVYEDTKEHLVVGYKDVRDDEFWVRGHFPGNAILPGVLMCECAAQLTGYYSLRNKINEGVLMGLSGIEKTRFRRAVRPGERLILVGKGTRVRARMTVFDVQGFVNDDLAFQTEVHGMVLGKIGE
ncbi:MAG: 3-hydroxyacyl-ACP dehydratase FabZ family protein [Fimbriiglobus sp.]